MPNREDLERMAVDWCTGEVANGSPFLEMEVGVGRKLATAAPPLALACLLADEYARITERGEQLRMVSRLREALRQALTAAGVEIADREEEAHENLEALPYTWETRTHEYKITAAFGRVVPHWRPKGEVGWRPTPPSAEALASEIMRILKLRGAKPSPPKASLAAKGPKR